METLKIPIYFRPKEEGTFDEEVHFNVAGSVDECIAVHGRGVPMKMMLVDPEDKCLDFGNTEVNSNTIKVVQVINKSKATAITNFGLTEYFPKIEETDSLEIPSRSTFTSGGSHFTDAIRIYPSKNIKIGPDKSVKLSVKFSPICRINPFTEK
ncbi:hypothetical protein L9F63_026725, partial [Diploptera punctata]